jgi:signal transduction histidine kinase
MAARLPEMGAGGLGAPFAQCTPMSSLENIYMKMAPTLEPAHLAQLRHPHPDQAAPKIIGRDVAHELNNILTIIRGYSDRMMIKHGNNAALRPDLQLISENVKRAEAVIRGAARINAVSASNYTVGARASA